MRIARANTGRDLIVKIDGHFNGGVDYAMVNSLARDIDVDNPGGTMSRRIRSTAGMPASAVESVLPIPWNDLDALDAVLTTYPHQVAAVVMVPIDFNNGCLTPEPGYLEAALERTHAAGALLIFDEVLSGLKVAGGSAQALFGVIPDLTTVSKAISSGVPLAGVVGRRRFMEILLAPPPAGAVQGGTFAGSALGLAAAAATLGHVAEAGVHDGLMQRSADFFERLQAVFDRSPLPARVEGIGCMFSIYLGTREPVRSIRQVRALDQDLRRRFFSRCIEDGIYFHTDFSVSTAHDPETLDDVLERIERIAGRSGG
jgi:glutamate-1-semialdehyde 2,1-aminomutase